MAERCLRCIGWDRILTAAWQCPPSLVGLSDCLWSQCLSFPACELGCWYWELRCAFEAHPRLGRQSSFCRSRCFLELPYRDTACPQLSVWPVHGEGRQASPLPLAFFPSLLCVLCTQGWHRESCPYVQAREGAALVSHFGMSRCYMMVPH